MKTQICLYFQEINLKFSHNSVDNNSQPNPTIELQARSGNKPPNPPPPPFDIIVISVPTLFLKIIFDLCCTLQNNIIL